MFAKYQLVDNIFWYMFLALFIAPFIIRMALDYTGDIYESWVKLKLRKVRAEQKMLQELIDEDDQESDKEDQTGS